MRVTPRRFADNREGHPSSVLALRVIPCLDVKDGRVVKGVNFVELRDAGDPVEQARAYDAEGADEITFLDITASHENRDTILDVVSRTAARGLHPADRRRRRAQRGGHARRLLLAGADKVSINSAAVADPDVVRRCAEAFGSQAIVVAIDARRKDSGEGWEVFTHGGRRGTGIDAVDWARRVAALGAGEILLTSMDRDGTKQGFDLPLTARGARRGAGCRSSPRAASAPRRISSMARRPGRPACSPPPSSTTGNSASPMPRRRSPPPACRCATPRRMRRAA